MSSFDETMLKRLTSLEREVERLKVKQGHKAGMYADTYFDDLQYSLVGQKMESPSSHITYDTSNGWLLFANTCNLNDYVTMNIQMSHRWKIGTVIYPHLHWYQEDADMPNFVINSFWAANGAAGGAWSGYQKWTANTFTYSPNVLNQITKFGTITPPAWASLSDIVVIKIFRDVANASTLFGGAESGVPASIKTWSFDIHFEIDQAGSDSEYVK